MVRLPCATVTSPSGLDTSLQSQVPCWKALFAMPMPSTPIDIVGDVTRWVTSSPIPNWSLIVRLCHVAMPRMLPGGKGLAHITGTFEHVTVTYAAGVDGVGVGVGAVVGVAIGVAVGVAVVAAVAVGIGVADRAVGGIVDTQAARLRAAMAVPMTVVSFMAVVTHSTRTRHHGYVQGNAWTQSQHPRRNRCRPRRDHAVPAPLFNSPLRMTPYLVTRPDGEGRAITK
jgi:hypothetical protein